MNARELLAEARLVMDRELSGPIYQVLDLLHRAIEAQVEHPHVMEIVKGEEQSRESAERLGFPYVCGGSGGAGTPEKDE